MARTQDDLLHLQPLFPYFLLWLTLLKVENSNNKREIISRSGNKLSAQNDIR